MLGGLAVRIWLHRAALLNAAGEPIPLTHRPALLSHSYVVLTFLAWRVADSTPRDQGGKHSSRIVVFHLDVCSA